MTVQAPTTAGRTTQPFGASPGGYNPWGGHTGEDIALPVGTPLGAMADGTVVHVGTFTGKYWDNPWLVEPDWAGFVVVVDYGPFLSLYCHCSGSPVKVGDRVRGGQTVALSGNSGSATSGPHLHWETMLDGWNFQNGTYGRVNPRSLLTTLTTQSTIRKGLFMALSPSQEQEVLAAARKINRYLNAPTGDIPRKVVTALLDAPVPRKGGRTGDTTLRNTLSYLDANLDAAKEAKE